MQQSTSPGPSPDRTIRESLSWLDLELFRELDRTGPRYTSYPTADRFVEAFDARAYALWALKRNVGPISRPLSLYVHIPFCREVCFYCACNKIVTRDTRKAERYLKALEREVAMQGTLFPDDNTVMQLHLGGGTPTIFSPQQLSRLMKVIREHFELLPGGERAIEVDPRSASEGMVEELAALGFNRLSMGVQDFDPPVQRAINRIQSEDETAAIIHAARRSGFRSLNIDLIYGLPKQTVEGFGRTLDKVIAMSPDRMAIYSYAHLPHMFKSQRRIAQEELPDARTKLRLLRLAAERLTDAGYVHIGMDHFAKPEDELAHAQRHGTLQRNFQGYSTHASSHLVALGASALGMIGPTYHQNFRTLEDYCNAIASGALPVMRGIELSHDDLTRRAVIQGLMCRFEISKEAIESAYLVEFDRYFATELAELDALAAKDWLVLEDRWISATAKGRLLVRNIAMVFDKYLRADQKRSRYAKLL